MPGHCAAPSVFHQDARSRLQNWLNKRPSPALLTGMSKSDHLAHDKGSPPVPDLALEQMDGPDLLPSGFVDSNPERDPLVALLVKDG